MLLYSVENITEGIKKIFGGIIDFFTGIFTGNWEQALNGLKSIAEGVFNIIKGIFLAPFTLFSKGINYHRGGPAIINEGGRGEIVDLPNGSKVIPSDKSEKLLDKNNNTINVTVNVYNPNDVDEIINKFAYKLKLANNNM